MCITNSCFSDTWNAISSLNTVEAVDKKQEDEEESEPIIEEQEDEEQPTFQFNLSVNTQLDMKQKEGDKKREEAEKKRQRQIRDAQRMTSNLINFDGVDFMDEYKGWWCMLTGAIFVHLHIIRSVVLLFHWHIKGGKANVFCNW